MRPVHIASMCPRAIALLLLLSGCAGLHPVVPDTARLPAGALGSGFDPDVTAMNLAAWAFADSSRTYGRPVDAARAAASLEYVAGEFYTSPRWANIDALTKEQLLQGRIELRDALGVAPGASSQQVVDGLTGAASALAAGNQAGAVLALSGPAFPLGGEQELARLSNLPYMQMANVSTIKAVNELFEPNGTDRL